VPTLFFAASSLRYLRCGWLAQEGLPKAQAEGGPACPVLVCGTPKANQQASDTAAPFCPNRCAALRPLGVLRAHPAALRLSLSADSVVRARALGTTARESRLRSPAAAGLTGPNDRLFATIMHRRRRTSSGRRIGSLLARGWSSIHSCKHCTAPTRAACARSRLHTHARARPLPGVVRRADTVSAAVLGPDCVVGYNVGSGLGCQL
jgi:hypothetical protein